MSTFLNPKYSDKAKYSIKNSTKRINIWHGSVRSGKTIASIVRWVQYILSFKDGKFLMIGKTLDALKRNILIDLQEIVGVDNFSYSLGTRQGLLFGRTILLAGANDERSYEKIQGLTASGAYCDEVVLYPNSFFKMLLSRLSVKDSKLFATCNPNNPFHYIKTDYLDKESELDLISFHFTLEDNPNLPPEYIDSLKKEYGVGTVFYKRYIGGLWVMAEGLVYDMFREDIHTIQLNQVPSSYNQKLFIGIDYGTLNPMVFKKIKLVDNVYYEIQEYYYSGRESKRQKTDAQYGDDFKKFVGKDKIDAIFLDPSAASFKTELRQRGYSNVFNANNEVLEGIRTVQKKLGNNQIKIVKEKCPETIKELNTYSWDEKASMRGEDIPVKQSDHTLDVTRYVVSSTTSKTGNNTLSGHAKGV